MTTTRKKNVAGYVDEIGRFRPIRSPQFVSHPARKATRKLASKYSRAKAGDLGKARQERALEDVFAREIRTQAEQSAADKREKARLMREIESDIYGDADTKGKGRTLLQFVRGHGGIRRTYYHGGKKLRGVERKSYDKGEIDRLSFKQTGKRGLTTDKGGKTMDGMFQAARESGYNVASIDDMMSQIESEAAGGNPTYATHGFLASGYRDNPSRMAKAAISAFDTDYDLDLDLKDVARLKRGEKKLAARKKAVRKTTTAKRKNPLDPLIAVTTGLSGIMSALTIKKMLAEDEKKKVMRRKTTTRRRINGTTAAKPRTAVKRNSSLFGSGEAYTRTVKFGNGKIRSVHVIDSRSGKSLAKYKSLAGAKRYATANGIRLEVNPSKAQRPKTKDQSRNPKSKAAPAKKNGVVSRFIGRRKAAAEYRKELRLQSAIERSRKRRSKAESKAKGNPKGKFVIERHIRRDGSSIYVVADDSSETIVTHPASTAASARSRAVSIGYGPIPKKVGRVIDLRKVNPRGSRVGTRAVARLSKANPKTAARRRTYEMFQGRRSENVRPLVVSRFAPDRMDQLGDLIELKLADGQIIKPNPTRFKLCAAGGKMWIAGGKFAKANPKGKANELNPIERIDHVVYRTHKPHHGDKPRTHYIHLLGEETGHMPMLAVDREGFPVIRGGRYKIEARGIVN